MNQEKRRVISKSIGVLLLFAVVVMLQVGLSITATQAKTHKFYGTYVRTMKQSNGERMKCTLKISESGEFELDVEGLYGEHHFDNYMGSFKKIGANTYRGKDEIQE